MTELELLWMLAEHLALTALPGALGAFVAMRRGLRSVPLLLCVALASSGLTAILAFWAFYADPTAGQAFAFLVAIGSVYGIVLCRPDRLDRGVLRELALPAALWALASVFLVYLGFVHGGEGEPLMMATTRFSHPLPGDNQIPNFFADWFFHHGHDGPPPPFGDWLSSDRPPLQVGYALSQRPFGWDDLGLHYEVLAVIVQQLWILGMWAVLCAARLRPLARGMAIVAATVSDVTIVNGFFVWPKLIAAAFLLAALAMVLSADWPTLRRSPWGAALFAALCALAMLAHGASAFGIVPLLLFAALRGRGSRRDATQSSTAQVSGRRWLGIAIAVGIALLAPWSAYQRYADPPGDRLVKWQLGGYLPIDERGAFETIVDGYEEAGLGGALENKWRNVTTMVGQQAEEGAVPAAIDDLEEGHPGEAVAALRQPRFFNLLLFLGILLIAPIAMLVRRLLGGRPEGPEWRFAVTALGFCALVAACWALLLFGSPETTATMHVGTLALPLLAVCACVAGALAVSRAFGIVLTGANVLLVLALYVPYIGPPPGTSYSALGAALAGLALAGFGYLALRPGAR